MSFDLSVTRFLNIAAVSNPFIRILAIGGATYAIWLMGAAALWVGWKKRTLLLLAAETLIVFIVNYAIAAVAFRSRPSEGITRLIGQPHSLKSFPSDHVAIATALTWMVWMSVPHAGWVMALLTVFIAFGRVAVGVHYPTDVIGGVIVGSLAFFLARLIVR